MTATDQPQKTLHGRGIKRFQEKSGRKQEALAIELGEDWWQKQVLLWEEHKNIEDDVLMEVSNDLKVPAELIKYFDKQVAINCVPTTGNNHDNATGNSLLSCQRTFNSIDKRPDRMEENRRFCEQIPSLK